jgi:hypothetical protein
MVNIQFEGKRQKAKGKRQKAEAGEPNLRVFENLESLESKV